MTHTADASSNRPRALVSAIQTACKVGGVETWSLQLLREARERGWRPILACAQDPLEHEKVFQEVPEGISQTPVLRSSWRAITAAASGPFDGWLPACVIPNCCQELHAMCALWLRKDFRRLRLIGMCHSDEDYYYALLSWYEPIIHRFVGVSDICVEKLRRLLPHRTTDIVLRPYGIDVPASLERTYAAPGEPLQVLYAGRIVEYQKRVFDLLRLAELLGDRKVNFRLRIVGEGLEKQALLRRHRRLAAPVRDRVSIEPAIQHGAMPKLFQATDVAVQVSSFEGTSLFMLEAMAQGVVPVMTAVSGTAALIQQGLTGYRVPAGDLGAMTDTLGALAANRDLLAALGREAHRRVREFSQEDYNLWFFQMLEEVWAEPPRAWPDQRPIIPRDQEWFCRAMDWFPLGARAAAWLDYRLKRWRGH
jgi:glycosyltransferase involved in cell wall biosynthesis